MKIIGRTIVLENDADVLDLKNIVQLADARLSGVKSKVNRDWLLYNKIGGDIKRTETAIFLLNETLFKTGKKNAN